MPYVLVEPIEVPGRRSNADRSSQEPHWPMRTVRCRVEIRDGRLGQRTDGLRVLGVFEAQSSDAHLRSRQSRRSCSPAKRCAPRSSMPVRRSGSSWLRFMGGRGRRLRIGDRLPLLSIGTQHALNNRPRRQLSHIRMAGQRAHGNDMAEPLAPLLVVRSSHQAAEEAGRICVASPHRLHYRPAKGRYERCGAHHEGVDAARSVLDDEACRLRERLSDLIWSSQAPDCPCFVESDKDNVGQVGDLGEQVSWWPLRPQGRSPVDIERPKGIRTGRDSTL